MTKQARKVPRPDLTTHDRAEDYVAEAEQGYDVDQILRRRSGRPAMGSAAASVESVRLDPELKRDLLLRAAEDNTSVSDVIRTAIGAYLEAGSPFRGPIVLADVDRDRPVASRVRA